MLPIIPILIKPFAYDFICNAFIAGTIVAIVAGIVGYFVVLRNLAFAGHALGHIGFAGATGSTLIGLTPMEGQLLLTLLAAGGMGTLGESISKNDRVTGIVLAFSLGLGVLFMHLQQGYAGRAMSILFGDLLGVSYATLISMLIYSTLSLLLLAFIAQPLLFVSLDPELAEAKGVSLRWISTLFLLIVAVTVAEISQVVGVLLVFALLIGPAAAAIRWTHTVSRGIALAVVLAVTITWSSITLAFFTNWPIAFWISSLSTFVYLLSLMKKN